VLFII
jgi:hypothetical protein